MKGIITKVYSDFYRVKLEDGYIECNARGIFKKERRKPIVGDWVTVEKGLIVEIAKRKNEFIRPPISNVDQLIIVIASSNPKPDLMLLDKQLIMAEKSGVKAVLCINKIDLSKDYLAIQKLYEAIGYSVILTSAKETIGMENLISILDGKVSAFAGNSGVGKSALTNQIFKKLVSEEGATSKKLERGKHTTKFVELYEVNPTTYLADTPGFSTFEVQNIECTELENYFLEFGAYIENCEYRGCSHIYEKKCGIKEAVGIGKIDLGRYERYCKLYEKLKEERKW